MAGQKTIYWLAVFTLPGQKPLFCPSADRDYLEHYYVDIRRLHPNIKGELFKLRYAHGRVYTSEALFGAKAGPVKPQPALQSA